MANTENSGTARPTQSFEELVQRTKDDRARVRSAVAAGAWTRADPDNDRTREFLLRIYARRGKEALQGATNDLQPVSFITEGAAIHRAVAKVVVDTNSYHEEGSGFLMSPELFITNQHVIRDDAAARATEIIFDFELDEHGQQRALTRFKLAPEIFSHYSPEEGGMDYAVVALGERIQGDATLDELGYCPLSNSPDRHIIGMNVNIIQHPGGQRKQLSVRHNLLTFRTARTLLYETDTNQGSSGSPVFNDDWEVVALHHYGEPFTERKDENGKLFPLEVNEGIRISAIYADLRSYATTAPEAQRAFLDKALSLAETAVPRPALPQLQRRPPPQGESEIERKVTHMPNDDSSRELRIAIPAVNAPVTVTIQIGGSAVRPDTTRLTADSARALPQLKRAGEARRLDRDYSNRNGFNERFIPDVPVKLAEILTPKRTRIAPLVNGDQSGVLKYQNFSVVMDKKRRFALLTATNIDGDSYLTIDRETGRIAESEGETWYKDPRILADYYVGQDFYSGWSHKFDRGHLTRRNDPTWGASEVEAERANADTFHFTNCSPQHFRFNQRIEFWQGLERYVLEQGVLRPGREKRMTVLQGPVLNDRDDLWGDDVQIPSQFWKIALWNGVNGPRAVGMLANQVELFNEDRRNFPRPDDDEPVEIQQFHVSIENIERLTKLDLSDFRPIDTKPRGLPGAGEALSRLKRWSDIQL